MDQSVIIFERQMEGVCDFRPELPEDVPSGIGGQADSGAVRNRAESPLIIRMIKITQGFGAGRAEPFRIIKHQLAGIAVSHKNMAQSMAQPRLYAAVPHPVIARV